MTLYLTENDVAKLLTMQDAMEAVENAFRNYGNGNATIQPRQRLHMPHGTYHTMASADLETGFFGIKVYTAFRPKARFHFLLYSAENGDLLAMIEADRLGQIRTGAAGGIAARYLAPVVNRLKVGMYGSGWQAETQLTSLAIAKSVGSVLVYSRDRAKLEFFCKRMEEQLGCEVRPASKPEEAAEGRDVVMTATSSKTPVLLGEWLSPGVHLNVMGSNLLIKREVDDETVSRSDLIVVENREQAKVEAGDLLAPFQSGSFRWENAVELGDLCTGNHPGRTTPHQITLFKSIGVALQDVAVAAAVYNKAKETGLGDNFHSWS